MPRACARVNSRMLNTFRNNLRPWQLGVAILLALTCTGVVLWLLGTNPPKNAAPPSDNRHATLERPPRPPARKTSRNNTQLSDNKEFEDYSSTSSYTALPADKVCYNFIARTTEDYQRLRDWATANGFALVNEIPRLGVLRFALTHSEHERLLRESGLDLSEEEDLLVSIPDLLTDRYPEWTGNPGPAFGEHFREYLGIDTENPQRGMGVTIALLDTSIQAHQALENANLNIVSGNPETTETLALHGTSVASILTGANGITNAQVLAYEVIDDFSGNGSVFDLANAIVDAVDRGARIISMSLGTYDDSLILRNAVNYALGNNVILVAAAGNHGVEDVCYPAAYDGVVAVGAIDAQGNVSGFSNSGEEITLVAPGVGLLAAGSDDEFDYFSGTSAAVPCVSAVLANHLAENPNLTAEEALVSLLENCVDTETPGPDHLSGFGILNAERLAEANEPDIADAAATGITFDPESSTLTVGAQNTGTTSIERLVLTTKINGVELTNEFSDLPPGMVVSAQGVLPAEAWDEGGRLAVQTTVSISGDQDMRPTNQRHFRIFESTESK